MSTNEEGRILIEKIEGVITHKKIHFLDVRVSYFRVLVAGYFVRTGPVQSPE